MWTQLQAAPDESEPPAGSDALMLKLPWCVGNEAQLLPISPNNFSAHIGILRVANSHFSYATALCKRRRYGVLQRYGCQADGNDCQNNFGVSVGSHGGLLYERSLCQIVCPTL
jgi:hypothetical protein